jgi:hypothetical protein
MFFKPGEVQKKEHLMIHILIVLTIPVSTR